MKLINIYIILATILLLFLWKLFIIPKLKEKKISGIPLIDGMYSTLLVILSLHFSSKLDITKSLDVFNHLADF